MRWHCPFRNSAKTQCRDSDGIEPAVAVYRLSGNGAAEMIGGPVAGKVALRRERVMQAIHGALNRWSFRLRRTVRFPWDAKILPGTGLGCIARVWQAGALPHPFAALAARQPSPNFAAEPFFAASAYLATLALSASSAALLRAGLPPPGTLPAGELVLTAEKPSERPTGRAASSLIAPPTRSGTNGHFRHEGENKLEHGRGKPSGSCISPRTPPVPSRYGRLYADRPDLYAKAEARRR